MLIGAHQSISGGIYKCFERASFDKSEVFQIFTKNSNRWQGKDYSDKDIEKFRQLSADFGSRNICAHASYLINLASPKPETFDKSVNALVDELKRCDTLAVPYYVIHPGSHLKTGETEGLKKIIKAVDDVYKESGFNVHLLYETTAGMGTNLGYRLEQIEYLINEAESQDKLGICLDSCHLFAAGYDLKNNYEAVVSEIFARFGEKVRVFHLNDSKKPLGSKLDRHELCGKGEIGEDFFKSVMNDGRFEKVLGILETPVDEDYREEIKLLKSYRKV